MQLSRFEDRVVIVTGAGSGIGEATAKRFAQEGACVVLVGRTEAKLARVAGTLQPDRTLVVPGDVSKADFAPKLAAATIERFGHIDVLVNNAGTAVTGPFLEGKLDDWRQVMATNVDGVMYIARACLPHLLERRGNIINVSSVSGLGGDWGMTTYNASKGAVSNLTRALALEFGGQGVRCNAVNPSLTRSEMTTGFFKRPAAIAQFENRIPIGRCAEPHEVAAVIAFLASEDASFVNGVNLPVDGGLMASNGQPHIE